MPELISQFIPKCDFQDKLDEVIHDKFICKLCNEAI